MTSETFPGVARVNFRPPSELTEADLVRRARQSDPQAFDLLVERYTPAVYRVVRRLCSDRSEAEAITQEAFLRAWENLPRSKTDGRFWPWLVTIALNAARDALKKARPLDFADLPEEQTQAVPASGPGPEEAIEQAQGLEQLAAAVGRLPLPYRMVIALYYQAGLSYEEVGAALGLPVNTVRTHLRRAKQQLRRSLEAA